MTKVLLDTNILIDYMVPDRPDANAAAMIIDAIGATAIEAVVCAGSLKDIYYITRKHYSDHTVREYLAAFMELMQVAPIDRAACTIALTSDEPDFEDGIVRAIGETSGVDFIITRDTTAFAKSRIKAVSPSSFAQVLTQNSKRA